MERAEEGEGEGEGEEEEEEKEIGGTGVIGAEVDWGELRVGELGEGSGRKCL